MARSRTPKPYGRSSIQYDPDDPTDPTEDYAHLDTVASIALALFERFRDERSCFCSGWHDSWTSHIIGRARDEDDQLGFQVRKDKNNPFSIRIAFHGIKTVSCGGAYCGSWRGSDGFLLADPEWLRLVEARTGWFLTTAGTAGDDEVGILRWNSWREHFV